MYDATKNVEFLCNDGESLPLTKCVCGKEFLPWNFILHDDPTRPRECPVCHRKMYFTNEIKVFVIEQEED